MFRITYFSFKIMLKRRKIWILITLRFNHTKRIYYGLGPMHSSNVQSLASSNSESAYIWSFTFQGLHEYEN